VLHHPYEAFVPVVRLLQEAASDPSVLAIRMTLYRTGEDSPIVAALEKAARAGKEVTAVVELRARFDEDNNIQQARRLQEAGAHVVYGVVGYKTHAKMIHIVREENGHLVQYAHLGTGNYNPATAKIYTDFSYLTSKREITDDLTRFFHFLTGFSKKGKLNELYMSPSQIKPKILSLIQNEARKGKEGHIIAKINSLVDEDVIRNLYKASQAGVKIELIVRGVCCLRPNIEGISDNISVISILGKYLEHPRVFYFKNDATQVYISSADWMPRNLVRRVELLTGIKDNASREKIIQVLQIQLADNSLSHILQSDGTYSHIQRENVKSINNHKFIEDHVNRIAKAKKKISTAEIQQIAARLFMES
jgi:polyphosphate kinase